MIRNFVTFSLMIFILVVVSMLGAGFFMNSKNTSNISVLTSNQNPNISIVSSSPKPVPTRNPIIPKPTPRIIPTPTPAPGQTPAPTPAPTPTPTPSGITASQVATHNSSGDCWLIINNGVYNVTNYIPIHPGGSGQIILYCGQDATSLFSSIHSQRAWNILNNYYVGNFAR